MRKQKLTLRLLERVDFELICSWGEGDEKWGSKKRIGKINSEIKSRHVSLE